MRPQSMMVEEGDFVPGVEASPMSIAGEVNRAASICERRSDRYRCPEDWFQLGQIGNLVAAEMLAKQGGAEGRKGVVPAPASGWGWV
jgi:hypothetical protein